MFVRTYKMQIFDHPFINNNSLYLRAIFEYQKNKKIAYFKILVEIIYLQ
jgi:hypothetical protein